LNTHSKSNFSPAARRPFFSLVFHAYRKFFQEKPVFFLRLRGFKGPGIPKGRFPFRGFRNPALVINIHDQGEVRIHDFLFGSLAQNHRHDSVPFLEGIGKQTRDAFDFSAHSAFLY
jgi:hypothetical protein